MSNGPAITLNVKCSSALVTTIGGVSVTIVCEGSAADAADGDDVDGPDPHDTHAALAVDLEDLAARVRDSSESLPDVIHELADRQGIKVELTDDAGSGGIDRNGDNG